MININKDSIKKAVQLSAISKNYKPDEVYLSLDRLGNPEYVVCPLKPGMQRILIQASPCYQPQAGQLLKEMLEAWKDTAKRIAGQ
jgi:hypothetical protein